MPLQVADALEWLDIQSAKSFKRLGGEGDWDKRPIRDHGLSMSEAVIAG